MRNLRLTRVLREIFEGFAGAEAIAEDSSTGRIFVATPEKLFMTSCDARIESEILWTTERNGQALVDLQYLYDENELLAVLNDGSFLLVNVDTNTLDVAGTAAMEVHDASWSPDLHRLAVADGDMLVFYDRLLAPNEECLLATTEHGKDALVTVGWGSKETQFQGSAGKEAREKNKSSPEEKKAYAEDSRRTRLAWRADAQCLVVSYIDVASDERLISIYDVNGQLLSRIKNERSVEEAFAVKPVGNYIATSTIINGSRHLIFFERNGEKRHEVRLYDTDDDERLVSMEWDVEASALLLVYSMPSGSRLELWTVSNYDWTRKWCAGFALNVLSFKWSTEKARRLHLVYSDGSLVVVDFALEYCAPDANVCVLATEEARLTNMARMTIPPPMCERSLALPREGVHSFDYDGRFLTLLTAAFQLQSYENEELRSSITLPSLADDTCPPLFCSSLCRLKDGQVCVVADGKTVVVVEGDKARVLFSSEESIVWIGSADTGVAMASNEGNFMIWNEEEAILQHLFSVDSSTNFIVERIQDKWLVLNVSSGDLYLDGRRVAEGVTSYIVSGNICLYITQQHKLCTVDSSFNKIDTERSVELGSRLLCCNELKSSLIMQMPRGNLESIYPRVFVLRVVRELISGKRYIDALSMMKKHRIDMNLLVDHAPEDFFENASLLISSTDDADLINLFVTSVSDSKTEWTAGPTPGKVARVCENLEKGVLSLEPSSRLRLFTVLLSALLKSIPPRVEEALRLIKEHSQSLNASDMDSYRRHWLHYVGFFVDQQSLFNAALATYDLVLSVQVAECSNRDPKEYLPLLNELRKMEPADYRAYRIDLLREDWEGALRHLSKLPEKFDEAVTLVKERKLYACALRIYRHTDQYKDLCGIAANYFEAEAKWTEATVLYEKAGDREKTLRCCLMARELSLFERLATKFNLSENERKTSFMKLSATLGSGGKLADAARALFLAGSSSLSVSTAYADAALWTKAVEIAETDEKIVGLIHERLTQRASSVIQEIGQKMEQIKGFITRLETIRNEKEKRLENIQLGLESGRDLEMIDAFSEAGSTMSLQSRRTGRTGVSRASTSATQRKRKQIDRKKRNLKEGGEYEDSAILLAIADIYKATDNLIDEVSSLLRALVHLDEMEIASNLQQTLEELLTVLAHQKDKVWPPKLLPKHLPGPLHAIYCVNDVITIPEDGSMPSQILLDEELIPPRLSMEKPWKLQII